MGNFRRTERFCWFNFREVLAPLWIAELRTVTDSNSNLEKGQYCQYRISKIHNEVKIFINPHVDFYPSSILWDIFWTNSLIYRVKSYKIAEVWNNSDPIYFRDVFGLNVDVEIETRLPGAVFVRVQLFFNVLRWLFSLFYRHFFSLLKTLNGTAGSPQLKGHKFILKS